MLLIPCYTMSDATYHALQGLLQESISHKVMAQQHPSQMEHSHPHQMAHCPMVSRQQIINILNLMHRRRPMASDALTEFEHIAYDSKPQGCLPWFS
jgi:hypothetical protein